MAKSSVLDPTMGAADWIYRWFEIYLKERKKVTSAEKRKFFQENIHGIDLDPVAVLTSRLIFWHQFDYSSNSIAMIQMNLIQGDALDPLNGSLPFDGKKFDVILGNPPYVVKNLSSITCDTNKTNNLYSAITESATLLLKDGGNICFVIPLSFVCSKKISDLRDFCRKKYREINYSNYAIRPMKMFNGVDQRISVFIGTKKTNKNDVCHVYSSGGYFRWRIRKDLINLLSSLDSRIDVDISNLAFNNLWPKIDNCGEVNILNKVRKNITKNGSMLDLVSKDKTSYPVYYYGNARYFIKAIDYIPYYKNTKDSNKTNSELKKIYAIDANSQQLLISVLNSKVYYWLWILYSDCFHVDYKLLGLISNDFQKKKLSCHSTSLMKEIKKNSVRKKHGDNIITEFDIRAALPAIHKIDSLFYKLLGLNQKEENYLKNYAANVRDDVREEKVA